MRPKPFLLLLSLGLSPWLPDFSAARADCEFPPLNAHEERQSNPVRIDDVTFTTGYYSYSVEHYSIDALRCTDTVNTGPKEWVAVVGLGGDEPIGPRVYESTPAGTSSGTPRSLESLSPLQNLPSPARRALPELSPIQQLEPAVRTRSTPLRELPQLGALQPLETLPQRER